MKRILVPFAILLTTVWVCASCLSSDDDDKYTYYDDTAITDFSLGTMNRYLHTVSSTGADSVYLTTYAGSDYRFYIDQERYEIYNPDSLPYGTDAAHVLCTISSKNGGVVTVKSLTSDSLSYYSASDSIDFSSPRQVVVYSNSGSSFRTYTVRVNVHQEEGDVFNWTHLGTQELFKGMEAMKAVANGDNLFVFGVANGATYGFSTPLSDGSGWKGLTMNFNHVLSADAYRNIVAKDGKLYLLDGSTLMCSDDGERWEEIAAGALAIKRLVGAGAKKLYGISGDGTIMASADNGLTWTAEAMDTKAEWLPDGLVSFASMPLRTNADIEQLLMVGSRSLTDYPNDSRAVVWGKIEDLSGDAPENGWMFYNRTEEEPYGMPRLSPLAVFAYDGVLIAFGGAGIGSCTQDSFSQTYVSKDGGITWKENSSYPLPEGLTGSDSVFAAAIDSHACLWIICGQSGQVWRGRLNRLGWTSIQKAFYQ